MTTLPVVDRGSRLDPFTWKSDGSPRHRVTVMILRHFRYEDLPEPVQRIVYPCALLAFRMADSVVENNELWSGLRELLRAKDDFVRARVA